MPRIPNDEIERLKGEISIEALVAASGVELVRTGANLVGTCPGHDDREPSLVVTPDKGLWHCMGACQKGGTVIDWVMWRQAVSFRHAIELLRRGAGAVPVASGPPPKRTTQRRLTPLAEGELSDAQLLERVAGVYHETLKQSPEALAYLQSRGLVQPEMVDHFRLGYANRTLGYQLPAAQTKPGAALRGRLGELGLMRTSGHEFFNGSVVTPLLNEQGEVVQFYGRKMQDHHRPGTPLHLYLPGGHRGVFNRAELADSEEIILCESVIDALTFWCADFRNVTSAYGIEGFTKEISDALVAAKVRRVKIAFDRDEAGDRGAEKVATKLEALGMETFRVVFPRGMDANEYARKLSPAQKSLGLVLRQATWMGRGKEQVEVDVELEDAADDAADVAGDEPAIEVDEVEAAPKAATTVQETPAPPAGAEIPLLVASSSGPRPSVSRQGDDIYLVFPERKWRARGVGKATGGELRVNVLVSQEARGAFFVDTVDLYSARQRAVFTKGACEELRVDEAVIRRELGAIMLELEQIRDEQLAVAEAPKTEANTMTDEDRDEALALLRDPKLLDRILEDLARAGVVGEETNKLVSYLAATSRKLEEPLAIVIQSSTAAGKSSLMEAVLALMPDEERVQYSAMTGQSLFYMSGQNLKNKVLAIVEEEGAERASYALKLLQSEGELTIASTGKDPVTGRLVTQTYKVEGPVMIFLTTTAIDVDEELLNRCLVLTVDEGREQTRAIHERQRRSRTLEGLHAREDRQRIRRVHKNAQRLLKPLFVVNPFAPELRFADHATRTRRDHMKYLTLISAVTLLHQYQRPVKTTLHRGRRLEYIETTREDIALATRLAHAVLGRSLDELPPQTRRLAQMIDSMVRARCQREGAARHDVRFSRRSVRQAIGWSIEQLRVHLARLVELEYVIVHRGRRGQSFEYELVYEGEGREGERFVLGLGPGLVDSTTNSSWGGPEGGLPGSNRGQTGAKPGGAGAADTSESRSKTASGAISVANGVQTSRLGTGESRAT